MPDLSGTSKLLVSASPSVITSQPSRKLPGLLPPAASYFFGPQPNMWSTPDQHQHDPTTLHWSHTELNDPAVQPEVRDVSHNIVRPTVGISPIVAAAPPLLSRNVDVDTRPCDNSGAPIVGYGSVM